MCFFHHKFLLCLMHQILATKELGRGKLDSEICGIDAKCSSYESINLTKYKGPYACPTELTCKLSPYMTYFLHGVKFKIEKMVFGLFFGDVEQKKVFKLVSRFLVTFERFRNVNERIRSLAFGWSSWGRWCGFCVQFRVYFWKLDRWC